MNFGSEIVRDMIGETMPYHKELKVLNIGRTDTSNLCVCYGVSEGTYTQFFVLNCDENHFILDPAFYEHKVYYRNRMYFFDYDLKGVVERLHIQELCKLPEEVIQEELKRCKQYLTDDSKAFMQSLERRYGN